ncbi:uncharacterized protein RCC_08916 [Ramularia collo-cygni]|uniref:F-box domain-containing protein n=1 Tax=Ramularia collo-cygni TaxID=112498 RepID=A0A2D3VBZ2_9PEZI|nr:uncharacterized protein RCC_08916 [Ramularia collo-cygni]CZT23205.1 uncharacterized protein RCC_08916 [Ramularia collo-cygni]
MINGIARPTGKFKHAARDKVLGTTELLEAILLGLDTKTLLLSKRVSKTFKATITDSLACQQALFLKPSITLAPVWNELGFPTRRPTYLRGYSKVMFFDVSDRPGWNNSTESLQPGHNIDLSLWYYIDSESGDEELRVPELSQMLLRQPAIALKLDVECSTCDRSNQWVLEAGATFGDLIDYLEYGTDCDCLHP